MYSCKILSGVLEDAKTVFVAFYSVLLFMFEFVPINRSSYIPFS